LFVTAIAGISGYFILWRLCAVVVMVAAIQATPIWIAVDIKPTIPYLTNFPITLMSLLLLKGVRYFWLALVLTCHIYGGLNKISL
jgi:hypothetical protein